LCLLLPLFCLIRRKGEALRFTANVTAAAMRLPHQQKEAKKGYL
jgi:hypothetical protein